MNEKIIDTEFDINKYAYILSDYIQLKRQKYYEQYSNTENRLTIGINKLNDIFDLQTGAIFIHNCEFNTQISNLFRIFFETTPASNTENFYNIYSQGISFKYACPTDNGFILRGPQVYYNLVCYKIKNGKHPANLIQNWKTEICTFLKKISTSIHADIDTKADLNNSVFYNKLLLGCLDNIRHLLTVCINAEAIMSLSQLNSFIKIKKGSPLDKYQALLTDVYEMFENILFRTIPLSSAQLKVSDLAIQTLPIVTDVFSSALSPKYASMSYKIFRTHLEADNFIENYIVLKYAAKSLEQRMNENLSNIYFCGILSGGCELAIQLKFFTKKYNPRLMFVALDRDYLCRQKNRAFYTICPAPKATDSYVLVDDNIMTGQSLVDAIKILGTTNNASFLNAIILRHPNISRLPQLKAYNKAVNPAFLKKYCLGLLTESPYTRIRFGSNIEEEFLDECGTFTLTGDYFLHFLYKNGAYSPGSEVDFYRTYSKEKY